MACIVIFQGQVAAPHYLEIDLKLEHFEAIFSLKFGQVAGILNDRMPDFLKVWSKYYIVRGWMIELKLIY